MCTNVLSVGHGEEGLEPLVLSQVHGIDAIPAEVWWDRSRSLGCCNGGTAFSEETGRKAQEGVPAV